MALANKTDDVKQVPWLSLEEWHDVYKKIYSNDTDEQTEAYEALLAWKARMPKLPAGVDCTLSILQVCLRDREWTSKIDNGELPMYCENDLSLMYSTTIMRFLNHFCNIGHTKETSLFRIAKQLEIPEWIVGLRHDAAHGHELPSIGVLRIAINILLQWLHDEYWVIEAQEMEKCYMNKENDMLEEEESDEVQIFTDLIELWTTVNLYIDVGYELVSALPELQLKEILQNLRVYMLSQYNNKTSNENEYISICRRTIKIDKDYNLKSAQILLLSEISVHLTTNESLTMIHKKNDTICNVLCTNEVFLPNLEFMKIFQKKGKKNIDLKTKLLPHRMLRFWKDIIFLLHRKEVLETLIFKLLNIVNQERESKDRRNVAALWISTIIYSFFQLDIAQNISHNTKYNPKKTTTKLDTKTLSQNLKEHIYFNHPYLRNVLWLDISSTIPQFLLNKDFLFRLLLHVNEFSAKLIEPLLKLVTSRIDKQTKKHLLNLVRIYTSQKYANKNNNKGVCEKIYTVEDLDARVTKEKIQVHKETHTTDDLLADRVIRNSHWKSAFSTHQWVECPIGLLPWQISLKSLEPLDLNPSKQLVSVLDSQIVAGIINRKNLKMQSQINWNNVLRKKKRIERKRNKGVADVIMNKAIVEIIKKKTM